MTKRFGRNQRRALREQVERLKDHLTEQAIRHLGAHEKATQEARKARQNEMRVREWAERITALLGPDSAFTREATVDEVDRELFDEIVHGGRPYRLGQHQPLRLAFNPEPMPFDAAMNTIALFAVYAAVEDDDMRLRRRLLIKSPEGDLAYMVDRQSIERMRAASRMEEPMRFAFTKLERAWRGLDPVPDYPRRA